MPDPDYISVISFVVECLKGWGAPVSIIFGCVMSFIVWQRLVLIANNQEGIKVKHEDHDGRIKDLERTTTATNIKIAELPTKSDLNSAMINIETKIENATNRFFNYIQRQ